MRFVKRVNERGVLTLPAEIREAMGVDDGDIVELEVLRVVKKNPSAGVEVSLGLASERREDA